MALFTCKTCGTSFHAKPAAKRVYCSRECMAKAYDLGLSFAERFWRFVDQRGTDDCWPWTGWIFSRNPYGGFSYGGKNHRAHKVAYELTYGDVPEGLVVMHTCDNPPCCNPAHLKVGTFAENTEDMVRKGRLNPPIGERQIRAKLTAADVRRIRDLASTGMTHAAIGDMLGVSQSAVTRVVRKNSWKHID